MTLDEVGFLGNDAASGPGNGGAVHVTGVGQFTYDRGTTRNIVATTRRTPRAGV